ncbi:MAG: hypothetical protein U0002_04935 [Thermoanaerobaculia bacterium]
MNRGRKLLRSTSILFALLAMAAQLRAQSQPVSGWAEFAKLESRERDLVVAWLAKDCEASEKRRFLVEIAALGPRLEAVLSEAFEQGPPPEYVAAGRRAALAAFEARQAWLRAEGEQAMSAEEVKRQLELSPESYADRQLKNADQGWRERALVALGALGSPKARAELERLAKDAESPYREAARRGLEEAARAKGE